MSDVIHLRGEGGAVWKMTLPLSPPIRQRYEAGDLVRVNADGSPWTDEPPKRKPRARAKAEPETPGDA